MNRISIKSYAKINLGLDVTGVLPNGYHTVKMIMQNISLYDSLYFEKRNDTDIVLKTNLPYLPVNEANIVYKAIQLFRETFNISQGIFCQISKKIPVAAGMAGGSGNGAAALKAMNSLFAKDLSPETLSEMGVKLGADVPFCLLGKTALSEGIGEVLTPLPSPPRAKVLLVKPPFCVSTAEVYGKLELNPSTRHPDIEKCINALKEGSLKNLCSSMENILEDVTIKMHPSIADIKTKMLSLGATGALMSGSGPTVFGIYDDEGAAQKAYSAFKNIKEYEKCTFLCDFT